MTRDKFTDFEIHAGDRDADYSLSSRLSTEIERISDRIDGSFGSGIVDFDGAVTERGGTEEAVDDERIGDRGAIAAAAVTGRPWSGTGTFGPNFENALGVDPSDGTTTFSD